MMDTRVEPGVWTEVFGGVVVHYAGEVAQTVQEDANGAVVLPLVTEREEAGEQLWSVRPGRVPVTREGQAWPEGGPGGFRLVEGRWAPA